MHYYYLFHLQLDLCTLMHLLKTVLNLNAKYINQMFPGGPSIQQSLI